MTLFNRCALHDLTFNKNACITQDGDTALILAATQGHTDVVVELEKARTNLNAQNKVRYPYLHFLHYTYSGNLSKVGGMCNVLVTLALIY